MTKSRDSATRVSYLGDRLGDESRDTKHPASRLCLCRSVEDLEKQVESFSVSLYDTEISVSITYGPLHDASSASDNE